MAHAESEQDLLVTESEEIKLGFPCLGLSVRTHQTSVWLLAYKQMSFLLLLPPL